MKLISVLCGLSALLLLQNNLLFLSSLPTSHLGFVLFFGFLQNSLLSRLNELILFQPEFVIYKFQKSSCRWRQSFFVAEKFPLGVLLTTICSMWAFGIRKNMPALPTSPHKRMRRVETTHHSSPRLVTMGATRGRKGGYYKYTCILHPPLSTAHINTHQSDLMCCTFPQEHLGSMQEPLEN